MAARRRDIELIPKEEWEKKPFGRILKWALTVGRYIVIVTELIVILAFLSRFKLDRDLTNLYEEIEQKQAIIESASDLENDFRFLQKRLAIIKALEKEQPHAAKILEELAGLTPVDVSLTDLSSSKEEISFSATTLSEAGLATFLNNLKNSERFDDLNLSQVSSEATKELGIQFSLSAKLAKPNI
jgi:Tfp pilus assembly protein PilN